MALILEETEATTHHYGNLTEMRIGEDALVRGLLAILVIHARGGDLDIYAQRRGIGKVA
jgi:hypothetical protein